MFTSGTVTARDANGNPVTVTSGSIVNGVISASFPSNVAYPLVVSVTGTYLDETNGNLPQSSVTPMRSFIADAAAAAAAVSGIPVTAITEMAVAKIEQAVGGNLASPSAPLTTIDANNAIDAAASLIGQNHTNMTIPVFDPTGKPADSNTVALSALAFIANAQPGADLAAKLHSLAQQFGNLAAASSIANIIPDADMASAVAAAAPNAASGVAAPVLPPIPTTPIGAIAPIAQAKTLLTSLRTSANLLHNTGKTGFIDTQMSAVHADFQSIQEADMVWGVFMRASQRGANMLLNGLSAGVSSPGSDHECQVVSAGTVVGCTFREPATLNHPVREFILMLTDTTPSAGATAQHTYTWSETVCNSPSSPVPGSCTPVSNPQTGTVTATNDAAGVAGWKDYHFIGNIQPIVAAASGASPVFTSVDYAASGATSGTNTVHTGSGTMTTGTLLTLAWMPGTSLVNVTAPNGWGAPVSGNVVLQAKTANYQFEGTLNLSGFATDLAGNWYSGAFSFTGSVTNLASAAVGKFMTGTLTGTMDNSHWNPLPGTSVPGSNYRGDTSTFTGSITNGTVTPAMVYQVVAHSSQPWTTAVTTWDATYTDPSNNTVTVNWTSNNLGNTVGTVTMGAISISGGNVYSGATLIGTISGPIVNFIDGTFVSVQ